MTKTFRTSLCRPLVRRPLVCGLLVSGLALAACEPSTSERADAEGPQATPRISEPVVQERASREPEIKSTPVLTAADLDALRSMDAVATPDGCEVVSRATTISEPGTYCLNRAVVIDAPNQPAIVIASDNVTLDLNGQTLVATAPDTIGSGVTAQGANNIEVRNGTVAGFLSGVSLSEVSDVTVEDLVVSNTQWRGVRVVGDDVEVDSVFATGLTGHVNYTDSPPVSVEVLAKSCRVSDVTHGRFAVARSGRGSTPGVSAASCTVSGIRDLD